MKDIVDELTVLLEYLEASADFTLPSFKELPNVDLYMEQVLKYVNSSIAPIAGEDKPLTSFMVNNYVKAKMINEPTKKKYSKEQIGYLIAITLMKSTISMSDMSTLLEFEASVSTDKNKLYTFWSELEESILHSSSKEAAEKVRKILEIHEKYKDKGVERMDSLALDQLAYLALRLSIEAQAHKLLSEAIIESIRYCLHDEEKAEFSKAEMKQEGIAGEIEANKLAQNKEKRAKKKASKKEDK